MNKTQILLTTVITALLVGFSASAQTPPQQQETVLFKIHDINPVKNAEAQTVACEFVTTVFNRTNSTMSGVTIDLVWQDNTIDKIITEEKKEDSVSLFNLRPSSRTENITPKNLSAQLNLQPIPSQQQISVKTKINTDRCFLLLEEMNYKVSACKATKDGDGDAASTSAPDTTSCQNMFSFIDSANPEYYIEFQNISFEEQKRNENEDIQKDFREIEELYQQNVAAIDKLDKTISSFQAN